MSCWSIPSTFYSLSLNITTQNLIRFIYCVNQWAKRMRNNNFPSVTIIVQFPNFSSTNAYRAAPIVSGSRVFSRSVSVVSKLFDNRRSSPKSQGVPKNSKIIISVDRGGFADKKQNEFKWVNCEVYTEFLNPTNPTIVSQLEKLCREWRNSWTYSDFRRPCFRHSRVIPNTLVEDTT